ncbi:heme biosynthesis HemY N-terminal domain-containing protein [Tepidiphilus margaritifer]|uniref:heme biosynthesis HemY N-terminal domain-containing protein n=1 Tax=Tepidiphilus margaritifer TaxID=203471 RepID=UPI00041029CC|nr:heme biosynthesis HemY N-terminal domain-containing protein [Tepidiphilus margaritifer]
MKALITLVLVAALAVAAGLAIQSVDGYVVFVVPPWRAQLSLTLFVLVLVLTVVALYLSLRLVVTLLGLPRALRARREAWRLRRAVRTLVRLVRAHALGDTATVHRLAERLAGNPAVAEAGAALAAATALGQGDEARAENWLARLDHWPDVRTVLEAEFGVHFSRPERLQAAMERLAEVRGIPEATALRLKLEAAEGEGRWHEALELARRLRARGEAEATKIASVIRRAHLQEASSRLALGTDLFTWWKRLPKEERFDPELLESLARLGIDQGQGAKVRPILEAALEKQWQPGLVRLYFASLDAAERQSGLARLERWLQAHPEDPAVLEALVELCLELQLWGKTQDYLARLRRVGADPALIGRLSARLQEGSGRAAAFPAP